MGGRFSFTGAKARVSNTSFSTLLGAESEANGKKVELQESCKEYISILIGTNNIRRDLARCPNTTDKPVCLLRIGLTFHDLKHTWQNEEGVGDTLD